MDYRTTTELAKEWGISARRVALLCEEGRLDGAIKKGKTWIIPSNVSKPNDGRTKNIKLYLDEYKRMEQQFNVVYPDSDNATYTSLLNYSDDLGKPFQRWYRYKEGFSIDLVKHLIREYSNRKGIILDPFLGSGSTILAAREMGYEGIGYEVNPFSFFLSECKLRKYSLKDINSFKKSFETILKTAVNKDVKYKLPLLSISNKVFTPEVERYYMSVGTLIEEEKGVNDRVRDLLRIGWLACLESLSRYRKAGNGLKIKRYVKPREVTASDAQVMLLEEYQNIYIDLLRENAWEKYKMFNKSSINMGSDIDAKTVEGIIFSPPYANCFDYTEIYKLELWFGNFVSDYADLKSLRQESLRSHLNSDLANKATLDSDFLNVLLAELKTKDLWDTRIPDMLNAYYADMFTVIEESYKVLRKGGFCCIVVGNSAYGGIVFPADLLLAEHAKKVGFKVDKIEVDRYIITSSQQYEMTKESGKYLRESVVCLVKA